MTWSVELPTPFSLDLVVRSHGWYQCPPFRYLADQGTLLRGERRGGDDYLIATRQVEADRLELEVVGPGAGDAAAAAGAEGAEMVRRMRRMLRLEEDLSGWFALASTRPRVAAVAGAGWGRLLRGGSLWEDVAKALLGTNVQWRQAVRMIHRLSMLGPPSSHVPDLPLFPTAGEVLAAGEDAVRERVRCGYRAPYLLAIAAGVEDGTFDLDGLDRDAATMPAAAVERELRRLPGIGPATAAYLLTFLGHYDRPVVDSSTVAYAAAHYFGGEKRSLAETAALFEHYAPYRALGTWAEFWQTWAGDKEARDALPG